MLTKEEIQKEIELIKNLSLENYLWIKDRHGNEIKVLIEENIADLYINGVFSVPENKINDFCFNYCLEKSNRVKKN